MYENKIQIHHGIELFLFIVRLFIDCVVFVINFFCCCSNNHKYLLALLLCDLMKLLTAIQSFKPLNRLNIEFFLSESAINKDKMNPWSAILWLNQFISSWLLWKLVWIPCIKIAIWHLIYRNFEIIFTDYHTNQ